MDGRTLNVPLPISQARLRFIVLLLVLDFVLYGFSFTLLEFHSIVNHIPDAQGSKCYPNFKNIWRAIEKAQWAKEPSAKPAE